jgi:hypothetical protein
MFNAGICWLIEFNEATKQRSNEATKQQSYEVTKLRNTSLTHSVGDI